MTDWSALGGDPVPGDPGGIRSAANRVASVADKVGQQSRLLQSVSAGGTSSWQGPAANGFRSVVGDLAPVLQNLVTSHRNAADALNTFANQLQAFQTSAQQLLGLAQQAVRERTDAEAQIATLTPQVNAATAAYNQAASAPPPSHPHFIGPVTDPTLAAAYQDMSSVKVQLGAAQQQFSRAGQSLNAACSHASALHAQANAAAQHCADEVNAASNWASIKATMGGLNDKAGWILNTWGVYGFAVTSDKLFNLVQAQKLFEQAHAGEAAAFAAWNKADGGGLAWNKSVDEENAAFKSMKGAKAEYDDSIAPAASDSSALKLVGRLGLGVAMVSDVVTFVAPSPSFGPGGLLGGHTDQTMAVANFAASGVALGASMDVGLCATAMAIPGVDLVVGAVLLGTAAYFAGEFVYQHWGDITSGVSHAADWVDHTADHIGDDIKKAFSWL